MRFEAFERAARAVFDEIPDAYKAGVDGLVVRRDAVPHPELPDIYTLGECLTEEHISDFGGPDTTRSVICLYWGSFRQVARRDPDFDWEGEIWETLTHELRHHLESLAGDDALEDVDYAADETFKRDQGHPFDPWYYQHGDEVARGVYVVEGSVYIEQVWDADAFVEAEWVEFEWDGARYRFRRPEQLGDVHFVWVDGVREEGSLEVVLVRRRSWWQDAKRLLGTYRPVVLESSVTAERVDAS